MPNTDRADKAVKLAISSWPVVEHSSMEVLGYVQAQALTYRYKHTRTENLGASEARARS